MSTTFIQRQQEGRYRDTLYNQMQEKIRHERGQKKPVPNPNRKDRAIVGGIPLTVGQHVFYKELIGRGGKFSAFIPRHYDYIIDKAIPEYLASKKHVEGRITTTLEKFTPSSPHLIPVDQTGVTQLIYPMQAIIEGIDYKCTSTVDIVKRRTEDNGMVTEIGRTTIPFLELPAMVGSKYCNLYIPEQKDEDGTITPGRMMTPQEMMEVGTDPRDPYGYFIIRRTVRRAEGGDKKSKSKRTIIFAQDNAAINMLQIYSPGDIDSTNKDLSGKKTVARLLYERPSGITKEVMIVYEQKKANEHGGGKKQSDSPINIFSMMLQKTSKKIVDKGKRDKKQVEIPKDPLHTTDDIAINLYLVFHLLDIVPKDVIRSVRPYLGRQLTPLQIEEALTLLAGTLSAYMRYTGDDDPKPEPLLDHLVKKILAKREGGQDSNSSRSPDKLSALLKNRIVNEACFPVEVINPKMNEKEAKRHMLCYTVGTMLTKLVTNERDDRDLYQNKYIKDAPRQLLVTLTTTWRKEEKILLADQKNEHILTPDLLGKMAEKIGKSILQRLSDTKNTRKKKSIARTFRDTDPPLLETEILAIECPTNTQDQNINARGLVKDGWGYICPYIVSEGKGIGLTKNMAMTAQITIGHWHRFWKMEGYVGILNDILAVVTLQKDNTHTHLLMINGDPVGYCNPVTTRTGFVNLRRGQRFSPSSKITPAYPIMELSVVEKDESLIVKTDTGRLIRPYLIVEKGQLKISETERSDYTGLPLQEMSFTDLVNRRYVEFLDVFESIIPQHVIAESPTAVIVEEDKRKAAMIKLGAAQRGSKEWLQAQTDLKAVTTYTHCMYDVGVYTGLQAADITIALHNYMERVTSQGGKQVQVIGWSNVFAAEQTGTIGYHLEYPNVAISKSMLSTVMDRITDIGQMVRIAFMTLTGENSLDAVLMKRSYVEMGGMRAIRTYSIAVPIVERSDGDARRGIGVLKRPTRGNVDHLDRDGVPIVGKLVTRGDILVGLAGTDSTVDANYRFDEADAAVVKRVYRQKMGNPPQTHIVIHLAEETSVGEGDKIVGTTSQKTTVARILDEWDMPFIESTGDVPDLVFATSALPGRGTLGWMWQILTNALAAYTGNYQLFATGMEADYEDLFRSLKHYGCADFGMVQMVNGTQGQRIQGRVFNGPALVQVNIHRTQNKKFGRSYGGYGIATGEPNRGKNVQGGGALKAPEQVMQARLTAGAEFVAYEASENVHKQLRCESCSSTNIGYLSYIDPETKDEISIPTCQMCLSDNIRIVKKNGMAIYKSEVLTMMGEFEKTVPYGKTIEDVTYRPSEVERQLPTYPPVSQTGPTRTSTSSTTLVTSGRTATPERTVGRGIRSTTTTAALANRTRGRGRSKGVARPGRVIGQ